MTEGTPLEIEYKFLIRMPDTEQLMRLGAQESAIVQTYLLSRDGQTERVRMRRYGDRTEYTHTRKERISPAVCREDEQSVSEEAYRELLGQADPRRNPIEKRRYCVPYEGYLYEIDVYPFWQDRAVMEVELEREDARFPIPPFVEVIRDVTADRRYKNSMLAVAVPQDPLE